LILSSEHSVQQRLSFDAVLFDMDGLLLDTESLWRDVWLAVAAEFGYTLPVAEYQQVIGTTPAGTLEILQRALGPDAPVEAMQRVTKLRALEQIERGHVRAKPGVAALVDVLRARVVPYAVATSTAHDLARTKLRAAGIGELFDVLVGGDQVAHGKPAPDIFLLAAATLGVDPTRCLVLEDSLNGLRAARAAGARAIMVPDLLPADDEARSLAWRVMPSLDAVRAALFP
jgi:HAD superfamily hydrolase (TIGR01509 family)